MAVVPVNTGHPSMRLQILTNSNAAPVMDPTLVTPIMDLILAQAPAYAGPDLILVCDTQLPSQLCIAEKAVNSAQLSVHSVYHMNRFGFG